MKYDLRKLRLRDLPGLLERLANLEKQAAKFRAPHPGKGATLALMRKLTFAEKQLAKALAQRDNLRKRVDELEAMLADEQSSVTLEIPGGLDWSTAPLTDPGLHNKVLSVDLGISTALDAGPGSQNSEHKEQYDAGSIS